MNRCGYGYCFFLGRKYRNVQMNDPILIEIFFIIFFLSDTVRGTPLRITAFIIINRQHIDRHRLTKASGSGDTNAVLLCLQYFVGIFQKVCFIHIYFRIQSMLETLIPSVHIKSHILSLPHYFQPHLHLHRSPEHFDFQPGLPFVTVDFPDQSFASFQRTAGHHHPVILDDSL